MKYVIKLLVVAIGGIVLFFMISAFYELIRTREYMSSPLTIVNIKIVNEQIRMQLDAGYKLTIVQRSNGEKAHNGYFTFRKQIDSNNRVTLIIGNLEHTNKFNTNTKFFAYKIISDYPVRDYSEGEDFKWQFIFPKTSFNSRIIPKGDTLEIYGMTVDSSKIIDHQYVKEYRYIGKFEEIGFAVKDETWLIRNVPIVLHTESLKYGSLSFLISPDNKIAFMIYFVNSNSSELYSQYFNELGETLDSLQVYGFPGRKQ